MRSVDTAPPTGKADAGRGAIPDCTDAKVQAKRRPWVKHLFADADYDRLKLMDKATYLDFVIEIIHRSEEQMASRFCPAAGSSNAPSTG
jgi:hypothetical protein